MNKIRAVDGSAILVFEWSVNGSFCNVVFLFLELLFCYQLVFYTKRRPKYSIHSLFAYTSHFSQHKVSIFSNTWSIDIFFNHIPKLKQLSYSDTASSDNNDSKAIIGYELHSGGAADAHLHSSENPSGVQQLENSTGDPSRSAFHLHTSETLRNLPSGSNCSAAQPKSHHVSAYALAPSKHGRCFRHPAFPQWKRPPQPSG